MKISMKKFPLAAIFLMGLALFPSCNRNLRIGSVVRLDGEDGIVYQLSEDGKHGKAISISEANNIEWDSAKSWCTSLKGEGWHLPSQSELQEVVNSRDEINSMLLEREESTILEGLTWYWTSDSTGNNHAVCYGPYGFRSYFVGGVSGNYRVRAIRTF